MAPDSDCEGDDRNDVISFPPRARQRFTTSTETLTPPSLPPAGDSLHAPPLPPLPFDILVEILCRLPVKPLLQFRCVCKSWNSLISDPKFAKKHLHCSPPDFTRHHLMASDMDVSRNVDCEGDDRNGAVSFLLRTQQRFTTSTETLTPPSLHAPPLPFDILVEILCRLPVKSLLQFRCVCKSWNSLISDPKFAKNHLHCSPPDFTRHHLMASDIEGEDSYNFRFKAYPFISVFNAVPSAATHLEYPLIYTIIIDEIVGSCNGIVCVANRYGFAVFWNPSTRRFKKSPPLQNPRIPGSYTVYGFGYDHFADSYKVVAVLCYESGDDGLCKTQVKVHTLGTNCWRMIQDFPSCAPVQSATFVQSAIFVSGKLNWLAKSSDDNQSESRLIISQDMGKECYQELLLPNDYGQYDGGKRALDLRELRDCLSVSVYSLDSRICDIWLMKEYGRKESWTKLFTVPNPNGGFRATKILHISKEDEVLVVNDGILYLYDNTFKIIPIQNSNDWVVPVVYVESLISPCF